MATNRDEEIIAEMDKENAAGILADGWTRVPARTAKNPRVAVGLRLSATELEDFTNSAQEVGLSLSDFLRMAVYSALLPRIERILHEKSSQLISEFPEFKDVIYRAEIIASAGGLLDGNPVFDLNTKNTKRKNAELTSFLSWAQFMVRAKRGAAELDEFYRRELTQGITASS